MPLDDSSSVRPLVLPRRSLGRPKSDPNQVLYSSFKILLPVPSLVGTGGGAILIPWPGLHR